MRILLLDIETAPNLAYVWRLFKENIGTDQITNSGYVLCWSAKWLGEREMHFASLPATGARRMMRKLHRLLDTADAVVTYNGIDFDIPTVNKEFVQLGFTPPTPYKQIDLLRVVRARFRFASNKLSFVCDALGMRRKSAHEKYPGFLLWAECMKGNKAAWRVMERYNKRDVEVLEDLYHRVLPWITTHPNHATFADKCVCPNCGSDKVQRRGQARTIVMSYPRFQCRACGTWFRGTKSLRQERPERYTGIAS